MEQVSLNAQSRSEIGKGFARRARQAGRIPAVIYGQGADPSHLSLDDHEFSLATSRHGTSAIFNLQAGGEDTPCIIREAQRNPVTGKFLHIDFLRIDLTVESDFTVDIVAQGAPKGVKEGGVLETLARSVSIRCLPTVLPHEIFMDVSALGFGESLHASDLVLPEGVTLMDDPDMALFTVIAPRTEQEIEALEAAQEGEAAEGEAEPEVIGEKSDEESGESE